MESVSLWRKKKRQDEDKPKSKSGGVVPQININLGPNAFDPATLTPYSQGLLSKETVLAKLGIEPSFEGIGDTLGDGRPYSPSYSALEDTAMECVWCGGYGSHKPDCKALSRNYPVRSSLSTQREMTQRLRSEMDRVETATYYRGSGMVTRTTVAPEPKDERTDLQKRFDAIAEELEENK